MASILLKLDDEILDENEKIVFLKEFNHSSNDIINPEYIPSGDNGDIAGDQFGSCTCQDDVNAEYMIPLEPVQPLSHMIEPRVDEQQGSDLYNDERLKSPIEKHYNSAEVHIIHKGINYYRLMLKKFNSKNENAILRELKAKNLLRIVFTENINNEGNYIKKLVDNYPGSFDEIKFIISEERDLILHSSIFVNLAQRDISQLFQFIKRLRQFLNDNDISRACDQSQDNGISLVSILQQKYSADIESYADYILRFINRFRPGPTY